MRGKWETGRRALLAAALSLIMVWMNVMMYTPQQMNALEAAGSGVHIYADTPGDEKSGKYSLTADGTDVPVIKYSRNGNNFDIARFASADATP